MSELTGVLDVAGYREVSLAWSRGWIPKRPRGTAQWADDCRELLGKSAAEPGPWRTSRIPYLRGVMDALDESDPAPIVIWKKSSQVGGSEIALNWIGRTIQESPKSFLALFPSEKDARKWVRTRLNGMLAVTPSLRRLVPPGRRSDGASTLTEKHFPEGVLYTGSAGIPSDIASVSVPYLIFDEVDRMPLVLDEEGDPVEAAMARATTFARSKALLISSPTTEETSRIHTYWLISSKGRYFVPCPHCGHAQHLVWENLHWPEGRPKLAAYRCEADDCGALIEESSKTDLLSAGSWIHEHPEKMVDVKGFHTNGLYSPIGLGRTWAQHATAWDRVKGIPSKVQVFFNTRLGEVVKSDRIKLEWETIQARADEGLLARGTIPKGVLRLTCGVDVQHNRIEAHLLGWGRAEHCTVIGYETFPGKTSQPEVWADLDKYLDGIWTNSFGKPMRIRCTIVDSGDQQHEVTNFTRTRRARRIFAGKGSRIASRPPIGAPTFVDVEYGGRIWKGGAEQYHIGVSEIKRILYQRLADDAAALPDDVLVRIPAGMGEEYFRQLCAEIRDPKKGWVKLYDRNEVLDTWVYAYAAALHQSVKINRMREPDWLRLEEELEPVATPISEAPVAPVLPSTPPKSGGMFMPLRANVKRTDLS